MCAGALNTDVHWCLWTSPWEGPGSCPAGVAVGRLWGRGLGSQVQEGQRSFSVHGAVQQNNASLDFRIS